MTLTKEQHNSLAVGYLSMYYARFKEVVSHINYLPEGLSKDLGTVMAGLESRILDEIEKLEGKEHREDIERLFRDAWNESKTEQP